MKTCWKDELLEAVRVNKDELEAIVVGREDCGVANDFRFVEIDSPEMAQVFDDGFGGAEGCPFTAWGKRYVYFPITYDGSEWVGFAPRNPELRAMLHQGGE